jgi:metallo-beta-lactamase family protein
MRLCFLGATDTVTGSRFLVEHGGVRVLVDCGMFQGTKVIRERNWQPLPVPPASIDAVVLTHAHLDHTGWLPVLVREGFAGPIYASPATVDLLGILLPDAAHLQEEDADYRNVKGTSRHHPALPLFNADDARVALGRLRAVEGTIEVARGIEATWTPVGHILGACSVRLEADGRSVSFSGDVGRPHDVLMPRPLPLPAADVLVVESTYGGRHHPDNDVSEELATIVNRTAARGGTVVVPAFAVGRAQMVLLLLARLKAEGRIPDLPIYLDSPMAIDASEVYVRHAGAHRLTEEECRALFAGVRRTATPEASRSISGFLGPKVIVSASGMATGGRVLHHLRAYLPGKINTVLLVGFQAAGTRGQSLLAGAEELKIHGDYHQVRAEVAHIDGLSAHADEGELLAWLRLTKEPRRVWVVHGEPTSSDAMRRAIRDRLGWEVAVPTHGQWVDVP